MPGRLIRVFIVVLLIVSLIFPSGLSRASISNEIEQMFRKWGFKATTSDPGAYMAQTRGFITGGSLNIRAGYEPIQLFSINPPRIKAGCGGLDLYFGGISFINKDQFVNLLKTIGQNALGYAFQIGLEAVCPTCLEQLKSLLNRIQQWQKMMTDSCQVAKSIVDWAAGSIAESSIKSCEDRLIEEGEDPDEAQKQCASGSTTLQKLVQLKQEAFSQGSVPRTRVYGNAVMDALRRVSISDEDKEIIQSLVGTFVCKMGDKGEPVCDYVAPTITLRDFLYGNQNAQIIRARNVGDETKPEVEYVNYSIYPGFKQKVKEKIDSITQKLLNKSNLTDEEKQFIDASVIPVTSIIEITKGTPGLLNTAIEMTSDLTAISMAYATVKKYINTIESNIGKQSVIEREKFLDRIDSVKVDLHNELTRELRLFEAQVRTFELTSFFLNQVAQKASPQIAKAAKIIK
jgi:conjugative transfer pilus assembly protein TraH